MIHAKDVPVLSHMPLLGCLLIFFSVGCSGPQRTEKGSLFRSDSPKSAPRRTSENRPSPVKKEKSPFESDRMLINVHRHRSAASHGESHGRQALELDGFSHPACAGIAKQEKVRCPLSDIKWTNIRDIPGGVAMDARSGPPESGRYRMRLLCHMAFARSNNVATFCPLHMQSVLVKLLVKGSVTTLQIVTTNKNEHTDLRKLIRRLF